MANSVTQKKKYPSQSKKYLNLKQMEKKKSRGIGSRCRWEAEVQDESIVFFTENNYITRVNHSMEGVPDFTDCPTSEFLEWIARKGGKSQCVAAQLAS